MAAPEITDPVQYLTIASPVDYSQTLQRSQFICSLRKIRDRVEFDHEMSEIQNLYPKATHYCWAYRLEAKVVLEHASDAGEPAGTAGRPILGALKKHNLSNIMAVVTRYYGGVKLGVKGLIAAYGGTTLSAVEAAEIILQEPTSRLCFTITYDLYNTFLHRLEKYKISPADIQSDFSEEIHGAVIVKNSILEPLLDELRMLSPSASQLEIHTEAIDN